MSRRQAGPKLCTVHGGLKQTARGLQTKGWPGARDAAVSGRRCRLRGLAAFWVKRFVNRDGLLWACHCRIRHQIPKHHRPVAGSRLPFFRFRPFPEPPRTKTPSWKKPQRWTKGQKKNWPRSRIWTEVKRGAHRDYTRNATSGPPEQPLAHGVILTAGRARVSGRGCRQQAATPGVASPAEAAQLKTDGLVVV